MSEDRAEEVAARTVNKERARKGEARTASRTSTSDISSGRRGGKRSGSSSTRRGRTREQLYNEAAKLNISGRSKMNKQQLLAAVNRKKGSLGIRRSRLRARPGAGPRPGAAVRARPRA